MQWKLSKILSRSDAGVRRCARLHRFFGKLDTHHHPYAGSDQRCVFSAGAGIVADSVPEKEYQETVQKRADRPKLSEDGWKGGGSNFE
ncbi:MAG: chorismate-binding protein [Calditrichia bacterium]